MNQRGAIGPIVIGVVVVIAIAVSVFYYMNRGSGENSGPVGEREETGQDAGSVSTGEVLPEAQGGSFSGTVQDLFARGENLSCTFEREDEAGLVRGTMYVAESGERLRGDFIIEQQGGQTMNAHIIRDGDYNYFWTEESEQGFKVAVVDEDQVQEDEETSAQNPQQDLLQEEVSYNCSRWPVEQRVFELPGDREFVDAAAQIQEAQCSACDQLPVGPAKTQCLQSLGCE